VSPSEQQQQDSGEERKTPTNLSSGRKPTKLGAAETPKKASEAGTEPPVSPLEQQQQDPEEDHGKSGLSPEASADDKVPAKAEVVGEHADDSGTDLTEDEPEPVDDVSEDDVPSASEGVKGVASSYQYYTFSGDQRKAKGVSEDFHKPPKLVRPAPKQPPPRVLYPEESGFQSTQEQAVDTHDDLAEGIQEPDTQQPLPDLSELKGLAVQVDGTIIDRRGLTIGHLEEGDAADLQGEL
jgi:hypothetical protein